MFGQLSWNFRPEETVAYYDSDKGDFVIEQGPATLPDSYHRHLSINDAVESVARGSDFDLDMKFSVRIWRVPAEQEDEIFYSMNQEGDKADATRSKWLTQRNVGQRLAVAVVRESPHLTHNNVDTVRNTLSAKNPRLVAFNTIAVAFEEAWNDIPETDINSAVTWFVGYWDKLVAVRPELRRLPQPERQKARRATIAGSAIAIHGYIALARRFYDDGLDLSLLEALRDDKFFTFDNPDLQARGIVVQDVTKEGKTVLRIRNAHQSRRAMRDALAAKAGAFAETEEARSTEPEAVAA